MRKAIPTADPLTELLRRAAARATDPHVRAWFEALARGDRAETPGIRVTVRRRKAVAK